MPIPTARASCAVIVCTLLAALLPAACASTETRSNEESARLAMVGDGTLAPGRYELVVRGMSCPKCVSNVDLQLNRIDGVVDPTVDMKHGIVAITVREGAAPTRAAVAAAVGDAGFTLDQIREAPR